MIFVDAHVHIYDCFHLPTFLDSAFANFKAEAIRWRQENSFTAILLLAETTKENWFHRLASYASDEIATGGRAVGNWIFYRTNENCSLYAEARNAQGLFIIAGRQIVTAEGLELLALVTNSIFKDGSAMVELIESVKKSDAIPVVPWGFGKWMGRRGVVLKNLMNATKDPGLFLGDNSGRPNFLPRPSHFRQAEAKGIRILPGTDPLPLASECQRVGSFGLSLYGAISREFPARDLKHNLMDSTNTFHAYGKLEQPICFFSKQLILRLKQKKL